MATSAASMVSHLRLLLRAFTVESCPSPQKRRTLARFDYQSVRSWVRLEVRGAIVRELTGEMSQIVCRLG
jgi:hypothetical protein